MTRKQDLYYRQREKQNRKNQKRQAKRLKKGQRNEEKRQHENGVVPDSGTTLETIPVNDAGE